MTVSPHDIAHVLSEALPHMQRYDEEIVVVKYGGHAMGEEALAQELRPRHRADGADRHQSGGGARRRAADRRDAQAARHQVGIRRRACASPTRPPSRSSRWCWPARSTSRSSASSTRPAARRSGCAARTATWCWPASSRRTVADPGSNIEKVVDLGFVGEPEKVDITVLDQILGRDLIPVLAPLATSADGVTYNVNADTFAGAIAGALKAKRLLLLTDVPGVLDKSKNADQGAVGRRRPPADRRRHHLGRHDPEGRDLHLRARSRRRGRRHPRRQGAARGAARTAHRPRRRHADDAVSKRAISGIRSRARSRNEGGALPSPAKRWGGVGGGGQSLLASTCPPPRRSLRSPPTLPTASRGEG